MKGKIFSVCKSLVHGVVSTYHIKSSSPSSGLTAHTGKHCFGAHGATAGVILFPSLRHCPKSHKTRSGLWTSHERARLLSPFQMSNRKRICLRNQQGALMWLSPLPFSRIVLRGPEIISSVVRKSNSTFNFRKAYGLTEQEVQLPSCLSVPLSWEDGLVSPFEATTGDTTWGHWTLSLKVYVSVTWRPVSISDWAGPGTMLTSVCVLLGDFRPFIFPLWASIRSALKGEPPNPQIYFFFLFTGLGCQRPLSSGI